MDVTQNFTKTFKPNSDLQKSLRCLDCRPNMQTTYKSVYNNSVYVNNNHNGNDQNETKSSSSTKKSVEVLQRYVIPSPGLFTSFFCALISYG